MAGTTSLRSYLSGTGDVLYHTPVFTYSIDISHIYKKRMELAYSSYKYSTTLLSLESQISYEKYANFTKVTTIELVGAPIKYLVENGYKPIDDYKDYIKTKRKHGNKV